MKTEKLFKLYGESALLEDVSNGTQFFYKAFVQPLRYKNKLYLRGTFTEIGKNKEDYYLYVGPGDVDISQVDGVGKILTVGGIKYIIYRAEKHKIKDNVIYYWAIIRPVVEAEKLDENGREAIYG